MTTKTLVTAALVAITSASLLFSARADITTGLVGYWSLSEGPGNSTVADSAGNANTGTLVNFTDATYNNMWTGASDPNNGWPFAMLFNQTGEGANTYVSIPDSATIDSMSANKQWTLSAWVNCSVGGASEPANAGIIAKGNSGAEAFGLYLNGGKFTSVVRNAANSGNETVSGTTIPVAGVWYHVVATVLEPKGTADAEVMVYVNGARESIANGGTYTTVFLSTQPVTIGARANGSGTVNLSFQGTIDEVRLYNRALSATDVAALYANRAFALANNGIGAWNGLAGSSGNATLDTTSLNFSTNRYTAPLGTAGSLADVFTVEQAGAVSPSVNFADTYYSSGSKFAVASTNLTIAAGGVSIANANGAGTMTFMNAASTYLLTSPDGIGLKDYGANATSLVRSGTGTLILVGNNTFSGGVTLNSGVVQLGNGGAVTGQELGTATTVTDNGTLVFNGNNSLGFTKTISGTGSVTQKGSGTLTLSTANSYSGGTTISSSTMQAASLNDSFSALGIGAVNLNSATLLYTGTGDSTMRQFNGTGGSTNTLDVPSGIALELSGRVTVSGSGSFLVNKSGTGTLTLSGVADNANLNMNVNAGTVILNKSSTSAVHALGGGQSTVNSGGTLQLSGYGGYEMSPTCALTVNAGGVFDLNSQNNTIASLSVSGTGIGGAGALVNNAMSSASTLTAPVTLAANTTIGGTGSITLLSVVSGTAALTYGGSSTLVLGATNTYSGGTVVSSGTLEASVADALPGNVTLTGTGVLQLDSSTAMSSVATLTLPSSPNAVSVILSFADTQTIGLLMIGSTVMPAGTYGAGANNPSGIFSGSGFIRVTGQVDWDPGLLAASPGSGGSGSWNAGTADWFTGSADVAWPLDALATFAGAAGTVTLAANVSADELAFTTAGYTINNTDGTSVLTLDGNNPTINVPTGNTTISCTIAESGGSAVTVNGPGTLTLSGANTYAGGTTLNGATLSVNAISDANCPIGPSGTVTMQAGGGLSYTGAGASTTTRNVTANGAATSIIDVPAGSLTLSGQLKAGVGNVGQIFTKTGTGTLILGGLVDNAGLAMAINQGAVIITKSSAASVHGLGGGTSIVASGASLQLGGSGGYDLYGGCILTVNSGGLFDLGGQNDSMSTLTLSGTGPSGNGVLINSVGASTASLTNGGSGVVLAANTTIGGTGNITLASTIGGAYALTYAGSATLALGTAGTYSGGTTVNAGGTLQLNTAGAAGTGSIALLGNGILGLNIAGGTLTNPVTGGSSSVVNLIETAAQNLSLGGSMSGFTGTINCPTSPGTTAKAQILTTAVGLTSAATINVATGGTFYLSNPGVIIPCPVNMYGLGNSEVYGALRLENGANVSGPVILHTNTTIGNGQVGATKLATISGPISESGGSYGVTFTAVPGTIVLSGTNTYTGATTINGGVVVIGGAGQLGSGIYAATITNNATFNYASSAAQTLSGVISGTNLLMQSGPGLLTLSGANTYTGGTLITNGSTLMIAGSGCLGVTATTTNYAGGITNYGIFSYNSSATQTLSGAISGTGPLVQSGPGTLTLSAANTYTGATVITNSSTLALSSGGSINNTPSISIPAGATFDVSAYSSYVMLGGITLNASGTGTIAGSTAATIKGAASGGATVTLNGPMNLTYTPQTFSGDATHPALFISQIALGMLVLDSNAFTVNNAGASPLAAGTYSLIQVAPGGTISSGTPTVTVTGRGLAPGATAAIAVSGGSVNLVVTGGASVPPTPAMNSVTLVGTDLIFSGTNGLASGTYYVLSTTNVALPRSEWTRIATNSFSPAGAFSVTNPVGAGPRQFFNILQTY